jgi:hypothetical protein
MNGNAPHVISIERGPNFTRSCIPNGIWMRIRISQSPYNKPCFLEIRVK